MLKLYFFCQQNLNIFKFFSSDTMFSLQMPRKYVWTELINSLARVNCPSGVISTASSWPAFYDCTDRLIKIWFYRGKWQTEQMGKWVLNFGVIACKDWLIKNWSYWLNGNRTNVRMDPIGWCCFGSHGQACRDWCIKIHSYWLIWNRINANLGWVLLALGWGIIDPIGWH